MVYNKPPNLYNNRTNKMNIKWDCEDRSLTGPIDDPEIVTCGRCKPCLHDRLNRLLTDMDVPPLRFNDMGWLRRNLGIRNSENHRFATAMGLVIKISKKEDKQRANIKT